jgi:hypothetical protein
MPQAAAAPTKDHQAEPKRAERPHTEHAEHMRLHDEDRTPREREPKPSKPPREHHGRASRRPHDRPPARPSGKQPSGFDDFVKKYWKVGAVAGGGFLLLALLTRR